MSAKPAVSSTGNRNKNNMPRILAVARLAAFVIGTLILVLMHFVWFVLTRRLDVTMLFHRYCCRLFNIRVTIRGESVHIKGHPVIYLANHISYLDVLVLGGIIDGCFVAKSEVSAWPGFGFLAKLQKTIFIVRERSALLQSRKVIAAAMQKDHDIILFPEGTSTDGWDVLQFRAGLLGILLPDDKGAESYSIIENALVQPVAIRHVATNGIPVTRDRQDLRDLYAWYGDMDLVPHLWALAHTARIDVELHFLPSLSPNDFVHRFDIANAAQERVAKVIREDEA